LAYIRDQLGHHSIKVTVDIYGHHEPGKNKDAVDRLDDDATTRNLYATSNKKALNQNGQVLDITSGDDETRTRDLRRDRPSNLNYHHLPNLIKTPLFKRLFRLFIFLDLPKITIKIALGAGYSAGNFWGL